MIDKEHCPFCGSENIVQLIECVNVRPYHYDDYGCNDCESVITNADWIDTEEE